MPHIIIEHSADFSKESIKDMQVEAQKIMASVVEGNFDPDQIKCRSHSFDEYLVGLPNQTTASFLHITIKLLAGRSIEVKKRVAKRTGKFAERVVKELKLGTKRCDISVDVVNMDRTSYQKIRIEE